jgi:hypothetical protein
MPRAKAQPVYVYMFGFEWDCDVDIIRCQNKNVARVVSARHRLSEHKDNEGDFGGASDAMTLDEVLDQLEQDNVMKIAREGRNWQDWYAAQMADVAAQAGKGNGGTRCMIAAFEKLNTFFSSDAFCTMSDTYKGTVFDMRESGEVLAWHASLGSNWL